MAAESVTVRIKNWARYNGRPDVKQSSWVRLNHSIADDSDFFGFTHEEFRVWIYILCIASRKNDPQIRVHFDHAKSVSKLSRGGVISAIRKLQTIGILDGDVTSADVAATDASSTLRDETNETKRIRTVFDFEAFWERYPRKIAKSDAQARFKSLISAQEDYGALMNAVARFRAHHEERGTEAQYIPYPATFLGTKQVPRWKDWLDDANGSSDIVPATTFVGLKLEAARES